jgi:hypothetical protein
VSSETLYFYLVSSTKVRLLSNAAVLNVYPFVSTQNRAAWEKYTAENNYWVNESIKIQAEDTTRYNGPAPSADYESWNVIHSNDEYEKENAGTVGTNRTGPYMYVLPSLF